MSVEWHLVSSDEIAIFELQVFKRESDGMEL